MSSTILLAKVSPDGKQVNVSKTKVPNEPTTIEHMLVVVKKDANDRERAQAVARAIKQVFFKSLEQEDKEFYVQWCQERGVEDLYTSAAESKTEADWEEWIRWIRKSGRFVLVMQKEWSAAQRVEEAIRAQSKAKFAGQVITQNMFIILKEWLGTKEKATLLWKRVADSDPGF